MFCKNCVCCQRLWSLRSALVNLIIIKYITHITFFQHHFDMTINDLILYYYWIMQDYAHMISRWVGSWSLVSLYQKVFTGVDFICIINVIVAARRHKNFRWCSCYTCTKLWRGLNLIAVCLSICIFLFVCVSVMVCTCVCVCICVCVSVWKFQPNGCTNFDVVFSIWLPRYFGPWGKGQAHDDII